MKALTRFRGISCLERRKREHLKSRVAPGSRPTGDRTQPLLDTRHACAIQHQITGFENSQTMERILDLGLCAEMIVDIQCAGGVTRLRLELSQPELGEQAVPAALGGQGGQSRFGGLRVRCQCICRSKIGARTVLGLLRRKISVRLASTHAHHDERGEADEIDSIAPPKLVQLLAAHVLFDLLEDIRHVVEIPWLNGHRRAGRLVQVRSESGTEMAAEISPQPGEWQRA